VVTPVQIQVVCAVEDCSNTFEPKRRGRPRLYCDDCSTKAAYNRRWRAGVTNPLPPNPYVRRLPYEEVCERCGETYTKTWGPQRYCGKPGCGEYMTVECLGCGKPFEARTRDLEKGWGRFHSKSCALSNRLIAARERAEREEAA
jgi:hypothetical protein